MDERHEGREDGGGGGLKSRTGAVCRVRGQERRRIPERRSRRRVRQQLLVVGKQV